MLQNSFVSLILLAFYFLSLFFSQLIVHLASLNIFTKDQKELVPVHYMSDKLFLKHGLIK